MKSDQEDSPRRHPLKHRLNHLTPTQRAAVAVLGHIVIVAFWLWAGIQIGQLLWQLGA